MSGLAASASALLKAGNVDAAEREALALLDRNPHDRNGLDILISVTVERLDFIRALALAEDWIAREPDCATAHRHRIVALARSKKKRQARAALEAYRTAFPRDVSGYENLRTGMELAIGDPEKAIQQVNALREKHGEQPEFNKADAIARTRAGHLVSASRAASEVLKADPHDAQALHLKAVTAFRLCRFIKARAYARRLRAADPTLSARANETIYASYAVYFPPFLLAQVALLLLRVVNARIPLIVAFILAFIVAPLLAVPFTSLVEFLAEASGLPHFEQGFYLLMAGWAAYVLFVFQRTQKWRRRPAQVKLSGDY